MHRLQSDFVPAYWLAEKSGAQGVLPVIVTLLVVDDKGQMKALPCVEDAINRVVTATGREGLVQAKIMDAERALPLAQHYVAQALRIEDAILLMSCATPGIAEMVMNNLSETFSLSLVN